MSNRATTDKSKPLVLYSRIGEASVPIVFTFLNEDGTAHPIASYDFEYPLKKKPASTTDVFKLTVGNGLTIIDTNKLQLEITDTQATIREASYFGRLYSSVEDHTWVNVEHLFHDGKFDGLTAQTDTITVSENGTAVTITVTGGSSALRVYSVSSTATLTLNVDSYDAADVTAQAAALVIANPTGTPTNMQIIGLRIKDNGTARAISFGNQFQAIGVTLPTTTVLGKILVIAAWWNSTTSKWEVFGVQQEA